MDVANGFVQCELNFFLMILACGKGEAIQFSSLFILNRLGRTCPGTMRL